MNQGKLEVVKQEIASVNIDILAISELKWMGMGEFNSDDHYIYYCGQELLRRNRVAHIVINSQGKLDMIKQEMARVNINILGVSELKWMGMGEFNSNDH